MPGLSASEVSVVLPYLHNENTLFACLEALAEQSCLPKEVVVVDDASEVSASSVAGGHWPFPLRILRQPTRSGQAATTNAGIQAARSPLILMICADIVADKDLVAVHAKGHERAAATVGILGSLPYHPDVAMTAFMRFLCRPNVQFCFDSIADAEDVPPTYCTAPNFSAPRRALIEAGAFDERFRYGLQDSDLGRRLGEAGVRFLWRPEAIALHLHPTTLPRWVARQKSAGEARVCWLEKYHDRAMAEGMLEKMIRLHKVRPRLASMVQHALSLGAAFDRTWPSASKPPFDDLPEGRRLLTLYHLITELALLEGALLHWQRLATALSAFPDILAAFRSHGLPAPT